MVLKFKSKSLHDHFQAEWQIDLVRDAVRKSVTEIYGEGIKLVLEEARNALYPKEWSEKILEKF